MALYTRAIRTKIRSVGNIRKITRAMEMVAVSKMRRAVGKALATRPYASYARELLVALEGGGGEVRHPLLAPGKGNETLIVVFASNKGLCGGFNVVLGKAIARFVAEEHDAGVSFVTIGRHAERIARRLGTVVASFVELSAEESYQMAGLSRLIQEEFQSGRFRRVVVAYNDYISAVSFRPTLRVLLPIGKTSLREALAGIGAGTLEPDESLESLSRYMFEPSRELLLDEILGQLLEVLLFQAYLESTASEHSARMVAMKNATDNATDLLDMLSLNYNHARQDGITQELSEIAAGTNALTT
jgi:F-type H+-transporting ATPase subunit gamma